jgi:hypothetical protein
MLFLATRSYLAYKQEVDYEGFNKLNIYRESNVKYIYSSYHNRESITDPESKVHPQVTRSKPHAYTYNYYFNLQRPIY